MGGLTKVIQDLSRFTCKDTHILSCIVSFIWKIKYALYSISFLSTNNSIIVLFVLSIRIYLHYYYYCYSIIPIQRFEFSRGSGLENETLTLPIRKVEDVTRHEKTLAIVLHEITINVEIPTYPLLRLQSAVT